MAKRSSTAKRSAQATRRAKQERDRQIKKLKDLGLVTKRQNLKSAITRRNLLSKYKDVLTGKATVVTVPKGFAARLKSSMRVVGPKVVVPRERGERVRFETSTERIVSTRKVGGQRVKRIVYTGGKMPKPKPGKKFLYSVPFTGGGRVRFDSFAALKDFMVPYHSYKNWKDYLEIEEVDGDEMSDDGGDE